MGVDFDKAAINIGKKNLGVNLDAKSIEQLCKDRSASLSNSFSIISEWQVLEHVSDVDEHMCSCFELLQPNGVYMGTVPNFFGIYARLRGSRWYMIRPPEHLNYFTPKGLSILLERCGFEPVYVGTTFKTAAPLIHFGIRSFLGKRIDRTMSPIGSLLLRGVYRCLTLVKRYFFYFPINALICVFGLGGNSLLVVARKKN